MRAVATLFLAVVLAACAATAQPPKWHELGAYTFERFEQDFARAYASREERAFRRDVFESRLQRIRAHNADKAQPYRKGVNQFSDWTEEEFKAMNGYKGPNNAQLKSRSNGAPGFNIPLEEYMPTGVSTPNSVDYRRASPAVLTGVKNQGHCGSCWAHSTAESMESQFAIKFGQLPVLSTQQITACTTQMNGCGGGSYFFGWDYVSTTTGLNEEWVYPYEEFFAQNMSKAATAQCKNITKEFLPNWGWFPKANVSAMTIVDPNNAVATMEALAFRGPLSISVGAATWSEYEGGIFVNPTGKLANTSWEIDHAVQLVGYGFDDDMDMGYWIVRNSWGTTWGEAGYIRLYRPVNGPEPCGVAEGQESCGTSGLLNSPAFPTVQMLAKKN